MNNISTDKRPVLFHLVTGFQVGGAEKMLERVLPRLTDFHHVVLSLTKSGPMEDAYNRVGLETIVLGYQHPLNLKAFIKFFRAVHQYHPEILTTYLVHADIIGRIWGWLTGIPVTICSLRARFRGREYNWLLRFSRLFDFLVDGYLANSEAVRSYYLTRWHSPSKKFTIITNGLEPDAYKIQLSEKESQDFRSRFYIPFDAKIIGTVSQLRSEKKVDRLIKAWQIVHTQEPKAYCLIIGDGPLRNSLEKLVHELGVGSHIRFLGLQNDIPAILPNFDIFTLPSAYEGMSNAILEAMASGLPVIANNLKENQEVIDPAVGILVDTQSPELYAKSLILLLGQPDLRHRLGQVARQKIAQHFKLTDKINQLNKYYWQKIKSKT